MSRFFALVLLLMTLDIAAATDNPLPLSRPGFHELHVLSPTVLELTFVTTKASESAPVTEWNFVVEEGKSNLPGPEQFTVLALGKPVAVSRVGFKRRALYAPLKERDLRIGNYLYLQLAAALPSGASVEVKDRGASSPLKSKPFMAKSEPLRLSPVVHVNGTGYLPASSKKAFVGYYLGSLGELEIKNERGEDFLETWPRFQTGSTFTKPPASIPASYTGFDPAGRISEKRQRVDATFNTTSGLYQGKTDSAGDNPNSLLGAKTWQYKKGTDPWWIVLTDEEGKIRRYQIDGLKRTNLIEEVEGANTFTTTLNYDLANNLVEIVNHNAEHIYFGYDDNGQLIAMADPHLGQWTYKRDKAGRLREQRDGKGQKIT